jgi:hypothetical protein
MFPSSQSESFKQQEGSEEALTAQLHAFLLKQGSPADAMAIFAGSQQTSSVQLLLSALPQESPGSGPQHPAIRGCGSWRHLRDTESQLSQVQILLSSQSEAPLLPEEQHSAGSVSKGTTGAQLYSLTP